IQRLAHRRYGILGKLAREIRDFLVGTFDLLIDELYRAIDLADLGVALALAEDRVLRIALRLLHRAPLVGELRLGRHMGATRVLQLLARRGNVGVDRLLLGPRLLQRALARLHLLARLLELGAHLRAALAVAFLRLQRLQMFYLR